MSVEHEREVSFAEPVNNVQGTLTPEDMAVVKLQLWQVLSKQARRFTLGDSSSVPVETAEDLIASIWFVVGAELRATGKTDHHLLTEGVEKLFESGLKRIEKKVGETKTLWESVCISAPTVQNISYQDTLSSIGFFWKRYDYRLFAHHIPCDIDYQLCHPVSETLFGIDYLFQYLLHVRTENRILNQFDSKIVIEILNGYCPDYKEQLINLCEPVIANAVGLALIGKPPFPLHIADFDCMKLVEQFNSYSPAMARQALQKAAKGVCMNLGLKDSFTQSYVSQAAVSLSPRIQAALPTGNLRGVFI